MKTQILKAQVREQNYKKNRLRADGQVPGVLYGLGIKNQNISVSRKELQKLYDEVGNSKLIDFIVNDGKPVKSLIYEIQKDPLSEEIIHVDIYQIKEGKKITANINIDFIGEAPAVKGLGGILVKNYDQIQVECLPKDLESLENIKVDLSELKEYSASIHIKDLEIPEKFKVLDDENQVVIMVSEPKEEKVVEPIVSEGDEEGVEEGEGAEEGEKDEKAGGDEKSEGADKKE